MRGSVYAFVHYDDEAAGAALLGLLAVSHIVAPYALAERPQSCELYALRQSLRLCVLSARKHRNFKTGGRHPPWAVHPALALSTAPWPCRLMRWERN